MKHLLMSALCLALLAGPAVAEEKKTELKSPKDKVSYLIGTDMGRKVKAELDRQSIEIDPEVLAKGIKDVFAGGTLLF